MNSIKINIPCQQIDPQRRAMISALKTEIGTESWLAKRAKLDGRHMAAQEHAARADMLRRQLAQLG